MGYQHHDKIRFASNVFIPETDLVANLLERIMGSWDHSKPTINFRESAMMLHEKQIEVSSLWPDEHPTVQKSNDHDDQEPDDDQAIPWIISEKFSQGPFINPETRKSSLRQSRNALGCIARIVRGKARTLETRKVIDSHLNGLRPPRKLTNVAISNIKKSLKKLLSKISAIEELEESFLEARSSGVPSFITKEVRPPVITRNNNKSRKSVSNDTIPKKRPFSDPR